LVTGRRSQKPADLTAVVGPRQTCGTAVQRRRRRRRTLGL